MVRCGCPDALAVKYPEAAAPQQSAGLAGTWLLAAVPAGSRGVGRCAAIILMGGGPGGRSKRAAGRRAPPRWRHRIPSDIHFATPSAGGGLRHPYRVEGNLGQPGCEDDRDLHAMLAQPGAGEGWSSPLDIAQ